jgi:hypothetical protein
MLHQGGWEATKADLAVVPVPDPTPSYHPVPYNRFVEEVELHIPRFGLTIQSQQYALAREGSQMFGVLTCTNGHNAGDYALAIGLRNSYDRSTSVGLVAGTRVFCCGNLEFSGEVQMQRKHTVNVFRDLPDLIYRMLSQVAVLKARTDEEIAGMKVFPVTEERAHHLMVHAIRGDLLPASQLPKVLKAWEEQEYEEFKPRTAWSLFNAFTEVLKSRAPRQQMEGSLRLCQLFREAIALS